MCEKEVAGDEGNWFVSSKWQKKHRNNVPHEEEERKWWGRNGELTSSPYCISKGNISS